MSSDEFEQVRTSSDEFGIPYSDLVWKSVHKGKFSEVRFEVRFEVQIEV